MQMKLIDQEENYVYLNLMMLYRCTGNTAKEFIIGYQTRNILQLFPILKLIGEQNELAT